ncbi:hypothetical protein [Streptomyces tauricus]|uniref:hypothetical protein n=1 Tax=Streptomyces tauricus TaxID=68274 RepID=UPI00224330C1|nr:hypothetical protein [Streptomyces tauricus]MCW8102730.1 hypothetical protein [Streptomyces tauricus]
MGGLQGSLAIGLLVGRHRARLVDRRPPDHSRARLHVPLWTGTVATGLALVLLAVVVRTALTPAR